VDRQDIQYARSMPSVAPSRPWRPLLYIVAALAALLIFSVLLQGGFVFLLVTGAIAAAVIAIALKVRSLAVMGAVVTIAGIAFTDFLFFRFIGIRIVSPSDWLFVLEGGDVGSRANRSSTSPASAPA
jgi:hypothetical protein